MINFERRVGVAIVTGIANKGMIRLWSVLSGLKSDRQQEVEIQSQKLVGSRKSEVRWKSDLESAVRSPYLQSGSIQ